MSNAYDQFSPPPVQKQNTGLIIVIVLSIVAIPVAIGCMGILIGLLLPAVQAGREAARRAQCSNNLKQIGLALLNYESDYKSLPPAYTTDESGRRLHSWRTLILPYMEQQALYDSIDLSKPWDDPANQAAASTFVSAYTCPSSVAADRAPVNTVYQVVVDPSSIFPGGASVKFGDVADGLSNTVMVVETATADAVPWMSPQDSDLQKFVAVGKTHHAGGGNHLMGDGSVRFLPSELDSATRQALVTSQGGETVGLD